MINVSFEVDSPLEESRIKVGRDASVRAKQGTLERRALKENTGHR